ncbi:hypothetical protein BZA05DRAFT_218549 [Tricharina praecox]|uniref:uncharacterized protein n=1 Tax=Tricharina praecox TaxID=43433 RepID=UPI00221FA403|nr:uncharacterized protein BZA05DRAFT_218549 [Tricharina praecox]KAI5855816.1 hypothetical protein BZA05DRAFT_218549 [Tricharina praecox]
MFARVRRLMMLVMMLMMVLNHDDGWRSPTEFGDVGRLTACAWTNAAPDGDDDAAAAVSAASAASASAAVSADIVMVNGRYSTRTRSYGSPRPSTMRSLGSGPHSLQVRSYVPKLALACPRSASIHLDSDQNLPQAQGQGTVPNWSPLMAILAGDAAQPRPSIVRRDRQLCPPSARPERDEQDGLVREVAVGGYKFCGWGLGTI